MEPSALQKSMEKAMSICKKESEDEQTTKKRKEKKVDWFVFLTDDILLDILTRLPYGSLRYMAKYVCKRWLDLLSNMKLLDHASFILQKTGNLTARHVDIREEGEGLQVKVQDLDIPRIGMIRCWDHEFLLISEYKERKVSLYVYNIITKEGSYLPEFKFNASYGGYCINKCGFALSFDRFKGNIQGGSLVYGATK
ncbi:uncharacterized protein LOC111889376 [Lactuca sativa]|uniref:uncharacterized protein LOC111889376 n=1 Tax=Lactuca sativa TaxID=4236 RepID=UPI000CD9E7D1|nr:uncharacterized protein LOC111889376 [Lactuca sativa]